MAFRASLPHKFSMFSALVCSHTTPPHKFSNVSALVWAPWKAKKHRLLWHWLNGYPSWHRKKTKNKKVTDNDCGRIRPFVAHSHLWSFRYRMAVTARFLYGSACHARETQHVVISSFFIFQCHLFWFFFSLRTCDRRHIKQVRKGLGFRF
jgi:hypothetical protein